MHWVETIQLRVTEGNRTKLEQALDEIVARGTRNGEPVDIKFYRHAAVESDWLILLCWDSDKAARQGSEPERCLVHLLKAFALVSQSVWVEIERPAEAGQIIRK